MKDLLDVNNQPLKSGLLLGSEALEDVRHRRSYSKSDDDGDGTDKTDGDTGDDDGSDGDTDGTDDSDAVDGGDSDGKD